MIPNTLQPIRSKIKAEIGLEVAKEDGAEIEGKEKNETTEQDEKKEKLEVGKDGKQEKQDEEENEKKEEGKEEDQEIVKKDGEEEKGEEQKKLTKIVVDVKTSKCVPSRAVPPQESSVRPSNHLADWKGNSETEFCCFSKQTMTLLLKRRWNWAADLNFTTKHFDLLLSKQNPFEIEHRMFISSANWSIVSLRFK